jgi:hypothetical protein
MSKRHHISEELEARIVSIFEPVVSLLDQQDAGFDSGATKRGQQDKALRNRLNWIITALHRSARGLPDDPTSVQYSSLEYMNNAEHRLNDLFNKHNNDTESFSADPRAAQAYYYVELNRARYDADMQMLDAFMGAWKTLFGEPWKYVAPERKTSAAPTKAQGALAEWAAKMKAEATKADAPPVSRLIKKTKAA